MVLPPIYLSSRHFFWYISAKGLLVLQILVSYSASLSISFSVFALFPHIFVFFQTPQLRSALASLQSLTPQYLRRGNLGMTVPSFGSLKRLEPHLMVQSHLFRILKKPLFLAFSEIFRWENLNMCSLHFWCATTTFFWVNPQLSIRIPFCTHTWIACW